MVVSGHQGGKDRFEVRGPITARKHAMLSDYAAALHGALGAYDHEAFISRLEQITSQSSFLNRIF
jgi:hypothetical protein